MVIFPGLSARKSNIVSGFGNKKFIFCWYMTAFIRYFWHSSQSFNQTWGLPFKLVVRFVFARTWIKAGLRWSKMLVHGLGLYLPGSGPTWACSSFNMLFINSLMKMAYIRSELVLYIQIEIFESLPNLVTRFQLESQNI